MLENDAEKVAVCLRDYGTRTADEISTFTDLPIGRVRKALKPLRDMGAVETWLMSGCGNMNRLKGKAPTAFTIDLAMK